MAETIKGINIKLGLDGKDLDQDLKDINSNLKEQQKDLNAINKNLRYDSGNLDLWKDKQSKLNGVLEDTKKKLVNQNAQLEQAKEAVKIGAMSESEYNKLKRSASYTETEIARLNNELTRTQSKIKELGNAKFDNLAKLGGTLTKSITAPVLGAVTALSALAVKSAYTADTIGDTATKLGLSAENLQEWNHTAKIMGSSTESLNKAFIKVNGILGEIATGNGDKVADSLAQIGLTVDDLKGKNTDEAFEVIREALAGVEDASLRVGVANKFFGEKIGTELIPVLSSEKDTIKDLREEARRLGIVTNEQAEIAGEFTDALDRTKQAFSSLMIDLAMTVMPTLNKLIESVRDGVIPTLKGWIEAWQNLDGTTKKIVLTLVGLAAAAGPVLSIIGKFGPIIKTATIAFKALGVSGFFAGAGINFATLGIGALAAIVAMALLSNEAFRATLMRLAEAFMQLLEPIMDIVMILMDALKPIFDIVIDLIMMLIDLLMPLINIILEPLLMQIELWASLFQTLAPLIQLVGNILQAILVPALKLIQKALEPILWLIEKILGLIETLFGWVGGLTSKMKDVGGSFGDLTGGVLDNLSGFTSNLTEGISGFVGSAIEGVTGTVSSIAEGINGALGGAKDFIGNVSENMSGFVTGTMGKISEVLGVNFSGVTNFANKVGDGLKDAANAVGGFFGKVGGLFSSQGNLKKEQINHNTSNANSSSATTNHVTVNTTSPTFDIESINKALGGSYL
ncbi:hypothetical protein [Liberiplasma polymorphum]|uniref:hypothetical protein n=1 Tax=Liberiplasma polymorphum TaxID=3374570 RepID=UPI003776B075